MSLRRDIDFRLLNHVKTQRLWRLLELDEMHSALRFGRDPMAAREWNVVV